MDSSCLLSPITVHNETKLYAINLLPEAPVHDLHGSKFHVHRTVEWSWPLATEMARKLYRHVAPSVDNATLRP